MTSIIPGRNYRRGAFRTPRGQEILFARPEKLYSLYGDPSDPPRYRVAILQGAEWPRLRVLPRSRGGRRPAGNLAPRNHLRSSLRSDTYSSPAESESHRSCRCWPLRDTNAHFQGENPPYVYTVRFASHELWGADARTVALTIELLESYLERTTHPLTRREDRTSKIR